MKQIPTKPPGLRYTRGEVVELLGLNPQVDLNRAIRSRPGFPEKLPGTVPPLWSRKAVDEWFNSDAGRRHIRIEGSVELHRITVQTPDEIEAERDFLNSRYGGQP